VPAPFDESQEIEWSPNWSLTHGELRWLPTAYCYFDVPQATPSICFSDSNGCASGNHLEEAILQGFLELAERDAMALFWYNRVPRPAIQLESFNHAFFDRMLAYYASQGRVLAVADITNDLGIPVAAAFSWTHAGENILMGLGAHLSPRIAVSRAISELNQIGSEGARAGKSGQPDRHIAEWLKNANIGNQPYLAPDEKCSRKASDFRRLEGNDLLDDLNTCLEIVRSKGLEMIVLDLTRADAGFPTVRVTVPGLRHFWARFGPGRLYDVPVQLGWLDEKRDETELNPIPLFL
jgi:oxazoline/thiazoline synthase